MQHKAVQSGHVAVGLFLCSSTSAGDDGVSEVLETLLGCGFETGSSLAPLWESL